MKTRIYVSFILWVSAIVSAFPQSMIISGGTDHGVIICSEGYLYAWGDNSGNRLGLLPPNDAVANVTTPQRVNTPPGMTFSQVTAGSGSHTLALSCKGVVYAWGGNGNRECGQTTGNVVSIPTPVPHGAAPGYNLAGERNPNFNTNPNDPAYPYLGGVKYVCGSTAASFAILETGQAVGWGGGPWIAAPTANPVYIRRENATTGPILQDVVHIGTGDNNIYLLVDPDGDGLGDLYAIGEFLGHGGNGTSQFAVPVLNGETNPPSPLTNIKMAIGMDVGGFAVDGITGYVYAWGGSWGCSNGIGNGDKLYAMRVTSGMYKAISGEEYLADVVEVVGGNGYGAAVTKEGYMLYWGNNNPTGDGGVLPNGNTGDNTCNTGPQFAVYCTGKNTTSTVNAANPLANPNLVKDAVRLSRGDLFGFMVNDKNDFYVWGRNAAPGGKSSYGMMGVGESSSNYVAHCLQKLEIPSQCGIPDRCPEAYMVGPIYKCPEASLTLFSGFTSPVGNDDNNNPLTDRYFFTWYDKDGNKLNTSNKTSPVAARRADKYNNTDLEVSEPGVYKVEIEYIDANIPCDLCKIVTAQVEVLNKEMPVDTLITASCVDDPLKPAATDVISFEFKSKYATGKSIPSEFEVYTNATSGTPLTLVGGNKSVNIPANNPSGSFQVTGEKIASLVNGGVIQNIGQDTLYTIWIEDKTTEKGALLSGQALSDGAGGSQGRRILIEVWKPVTIVSFDMILKSYYGPKTGTITPVFYAVEKNVNGQEVAGAVLFTGTPQTVSYGDANTPVTINVNIDLPAHATRGSRYFLGIIDVGIDQMFYAEIGTNQPNSPIFISDKKDNLDGATLIAIGAIENSGAGNPSNKSLFSNIVFNSLSTYDCGRIKLTSRYWCPPCQTPDVVNGKKVTLSVPATAKKEGNVIVLCPGDDVVLTVNQLRYNNADATNQFDILWYQIEDKDNVTSTTPSLNAGSDTYTVNAWTLTNPTTAETKRFYVKVQDANKKDSKSCWVWDYVDIKVNPKPDIKSKTETICSESIFTVLPVNGVNGDIIPTNTSYTWTAPTVFGVTGMVSGTNYINISSELTNITSAPIDVKYTVTPNSGTAPNVCAGTPFTVTVTVNPEPKIADKTNETCSGVAINTSLTDAKDVVPVSTTYTWTVTADSDISGHQPQATATSTANITQTLTNAGAAPQKATYTVTPQSGAAPNVCPGEPFTVIVTVSPQPLITLTSGKKDAEVCQNEIIETIEYTYSGGGTDPVEVVWTPGGNTAPAGITVTTSGSKVVFSGKPTQVNTFDYKITLKGQLASCTEAIKAGTITINTIPEVLVTQRVEYLLSEVPAGLKDLLTKNPNAAKAEGTNTLVWYDKDDNKLTGVPTPPAPPAGTESDTKYIYKVSQITTSGCESKKAEVEVWIYSAPAPKTIDLEYCKGTDAPALTATPMTVTGTTVESDYELLWYGTNATGGTPSATAQVPGTSSEGETTYYVSQRHIVSRAEGSRVPLKVTVYDVMPPKVTPTIEYCIEANTVALTADPQTQGNYFKSSGFEWYKGDVNAVNKLPGAPNPTTNAEGDTKYNVRQYYEIASSGEVCYGDAQSITVTINKTPNPTGTFSVIYLKKEAEENGNQFVKNLLQQSDGKVAEKTPSCATCELVWYDKDMNEAGRGNNAPTPQYNSAWEPDKDVTLTYYVAQYNTQTKCTSKPEEIRVIISDSPMPNVSPVSYCEGETAKVLTATINPAPGFTVSDYVLIWYTGDPAQGGTETVSPPAVTTTITNGQPSQEFIYYVAQRRTDASKATSSPNQLRVTIYAKPIITVKDPSPICEKSIEIDTTWRVTNGVIPVKAYYYSDASANTSISSLVPATGTYYVQVEYEMPANHQGATACKSNIANVKVDIHDLTIPTIVVPSTTCPGTSVNLVASATSGNPGTITYNWAGTNKQNNSNVTIIGSGASVKSENLSINVGDKYTFKVTATAGVCKKTSVDYNVEIGDGPVINSMTVRDNKDINTDPVKIFTGDNGKTPWEFYTCGGDITITTTYADTDPTSYKWYINGSSTLIESGKNLTVNDMQTAGDRTYRLEYVNDCPTYVLITIKSRPLSVTNDLTSADMGFCQGKKFEAKLFIEGYEAGVTNIKWERESLTPAYPSENVNPYIVPSAEPTDNGIYGYIVTTRGCVVKGEIAADNDGVGTPLNVSGAVKFFQLDTTAAVCAEDVVDIGLKDVTATDGNTPILTWRDPDGTILGGKNGMKVENVVPLFDKSNAVGHRSTYYYTVVARNHYCSDSIKVPVFVDEPLAATLRDTAVCEGFPATVKASAYGATNYVWTANEKPVGVNADQPVTPKTTTIYRVDMKRGECRATDYVTVTVNTNPRIAEKIDSIGVRARQIVLVDGYGTPPFLYWVDNRESSSNPVIDGLSFNVTHKFNVIDYYGCVAKTHDYIIDPPAVFIPGYFSPNGDHHKDTWEVGNLKDVYPDALVTIYDRFGKQLIQYKGEADGWDGKYLGKDMPTTDYWYVIEIKEIGKQYVGHFTLLRR